MLTEGSKICLKNDHSLSKSLFYYLSKIRLTELN
jgi:hypothetical protein